MNKNNLKIIFFGTPEFVVPVLTLLIESGYNISAVFTGKGAIQHFARKQGIKIFQPVSLKKDEVVFEEFKNLKPDICIVAAYGKILPSRYLDIPKYGFLNIHPSILPKYRGPSPVQTAILNGDTETGVSIMGIDEEVDHGPIVAQQKFSIFNFQFSNHDELAKELFELGAKLLLEILPKYLNGEIKPTEQNHNQATLTKTFQREDGRINWSESGDKIYNQIRALNPEPGTWTTWKGKILNIHDGVLSPPHPGRVRSADLHATGVPALGPPLSDSNIVTKIDDNIAVVTKKCYLILKSIQLEGGKEMDAKSFVNGHPDFLNSILE